MDEVYKKENIYYLILNDQIIKKNIIERLKNLKTLLNQDRPALIPLNSKTIAIFFIMDNIFYMDYYNLDFYSSISK